MSIYKTAINKPITTALIFVAVIIIGVFSLAKLPIDQFPKIDPPYVTILTTYPGASASEIETNITKLLENRLNSVDGLKNLTSTSKDNMSMVLMEFEWGSNLDECINDVRSFIDMVKDDLPSGASNPFIFKFSSSSFPIIQYAITANESYAGLDKILNDDVIPLLNRIDGIGNLSLSGSPERYVYVDIDQKKLDAYNISLENVGNAIAANNLNLSAGTVKMKREQYQLEVRSEYIESSELNDIVVTTTPDGKRVFVKDIATLKDTIKDVTLDEKFNSKDGVRMIITKRTGANTVEVCKNVREEMKQIVKTLPSDVKIDIVYDSSQDIQNSINSLEEAILLALLFVALVILFFLGRWRATLIICITIPIALVCAFVYLRFVGSSLNIISLCSLTIAVGLVVDDAIVVLDNITRHIDRGSYPREASIYATNEVWVSVIATTLVLIAVFVPLTMLGGMAGIMFKELGWIVTIVISVSAMVAIALTPMLSSILLKARITKVKVNDQIVDKEAKKSWYDKTVVKMLNRLDAFYANALRYCLRRKRITLLVTLLIFCASLIPVFTGAIGTDFMQQADNGRLTVTVELQRGTRIEETVKTARTLEKRFMELVPEIRIISSTAGSNDNATVSAIFSSTTNNKISMTVVCNKKYERKRSLSDISEVLRNEMKKYPEIITYQAQAARSFGGNSGASTVNIEIYGYDFNQTNILAEKIKRLVVDSVSGARDVIIDRDDDRAELKIVVDKEKLALHGLSSSMVSGFVRNRVNGMLAGYLKEDGDEYSIIVRLQEDNRNNITNILNMSIPTPMGSKVKLNEIASIEEHWTPPTITRKSRQRIVNVKVTPFETSLGQLASGIENALTTVEIPQGISVRLAGDYEEQQKTFGDMAMLLALIVLLVYIVMASQFESFVKPFIIMMAIPFAITGVIIALLITRTSLDMIGALGVVMLVGIVVKNGIVLVDYINLMRDRGHELNEAIALSGQSRLRPVLMTASTAVLGMLPMALATSDGSEMWVPMGIVVIGGLFVSTIVTLIIVPVLYAVMSKRGERDKVKKVQKQFVFMEMKLPQEGEQSNIMPSNDKLEQ